MVVHFITSAIKSNTFMLDDNLYALTGFKISTSGSPLSNNAIGGLT